MRIVRSVSTGVALAALVAACGGSPPSPSRGPSPATTYAVESVTDGDTIRISPALDGASSVRLLNIDAPELNATGQEPWAGQSRAHLAALLPPRTAIGLAVDRVATDTFGRALAHVTRAGDGVNVNREQLRQGHAALYVLWPNVASVEDYRLAQIDAQDAGRGIWNPAARLAELPFEYRLRADGGTPTRPAGDFLTRFFVEPLDYRQVHVNNRLFFSTRAEAQSAGYVACPRDAAGAYGAACFGPAR